MRGRATMSTLEKSSIPPARARAPNEKDVVALSSRKSPLAGMGIGQKIATIALAVLAVIALLAVLTGRGGGGGSSSSPSSKFSPATYSDGPSSSGEKSGGAKSGGAGRAPSSAPTSGDGDAADVVPVAQLPAQARATLKLIDAGDRSRTRVMASSSPTVRAACPSIRAAGTTSTPSRRRGNPTAALAG